MLYPIRDLYQKIQNIHIFNIKKNTLLKNEPEEPNRNFFKEAILMPKRHINDVHYQ